MHIIFILPGLFDPASALQDPAMASLGRLLARADMLPSVEMEPRTRLLAYLVPPDPEMEQSRLAYWSDFLRPPDGCCYYCDPVHLRADLSDAVVFDGSHFSLDEPESRALVHTINGYLQGDYRIEMASPHRWYLLSRDRTAINVPALREIHGKPVGGILTDSRLAPDWRRLMNELQIVLHEHPVNADREQRGEPPINGVWIHSGGGLDAPAYAVSHVITHSPPARALSGGLGLNLGEELDETSVLTGSGDILVYDESLTTGNDRRRMLQSMEDRWFRPAYQWLRRRRIDDVVIDPVDGRRFIARRRFLHRFWRGLNPIGAYSKRLP